MVSRSIAAWDIVALSHWIQTLGPCSCAVVAWNLSFHAVHAR